jgi:hypothetical protein
VPVLNKRRVISATKREPGPRRDNIWPNSVDTREDPNISRDKVLSRRKRPSKRVDSTHIRIYPPTIRDGQKIITVHKNPFGGPVTISYGNSEQVVKTE